MIFASLSQLKKGLPALKGQEVKSVSFTLIPTSAAGLLGEAVIQSWGEWLRSEFKLEPPEIWGDSPKRYTFTSEAGVPAGFVAFDFREDRDFTAFEIQVVSKFYRGLETTRLRFAEVAGRANVEISTFMESQDPVQVIHEIPRFADALAIKLASNSSFDLQVGDTAPSTSPLPVDVKSMKKSPLFRAREVGRLPVIGFPSDHQALETAKSIASDVYGLAQVVTLSADLYGNLKTKKAYDGKFFVYWRDGSRTPEWFDIQTQRYTFLRRLFIRSLRTEEFSEIWRRTLSLVTSRLKTSQAELATPSVELEDLITSLQRELADARAAKLEQEKKYEELRSLFDEYIKEFDESKNQWDEKLREAQIQSAAAFARRAVQPVSSAELLIQADLVTGSLESNLAHLTSITQGAIVFTPHVGDTWRDAKKSGYNKPKIMEKVLENLCRFAVDYHLSSGNLGSTAEEYAKRFDLEWIPFDDLPDPVFFFEGKSYDQSRHVKADIPGGDGKNDLGRIHFDLDLKNLRVIVNHIGGKQYKNKK
jgi:hypothetical protein